MTDKEKLILSFIDGPLQRYLTGDISYGKFVEVINETCGTDFRYSDLYPSYLFNSKLVYEVIPLTCIEDPDAAFSRIEDEILLKKKIPRKVLWTRDK